MDEKASDVKEKPPVALTTATGGKADPYVRRARSQRSRSLLSNEEAEELTALPPLKDAPEGELENLLLLKFRQCHTMFDFSRPTKQLKAKEIKRFTLLEITEYIVDLEEDSFAEFLYQEIPELVARNLFRDFHPTERHDFELDEEDPILELAWPHFQLIYEMLVRFLDSPRFSAALAKQPNSFTKDFVFNLMKLFNSEDPRERDYLKTVLHRIYGKFVNLRAFIRKEMNNIFLSLVYEGEYCSGINEFLEILGSIVNGFAVPLKKEHQKFLEKVLLPLYMAKNLASFHSQLSYCVIQFINKDPKLGELVVRKILKYWPKQSSHKEIVFITEMHEILSVIPMSILQQVCPKIFHQMALSAGSAHFQVAEAALRFIKNDETKILIGHFMHEIQPVLLPLLYRVGSQHWHGTIKLLVRCAIHDILSLKGNVLTYEDIQTFVDEEDKKALKNKEKQDALFKRLESGLNLTEALEQTKLELTEDSAEVEDKSSQEKEEPNEELFKRLERLSISDPPDEDE